MRQTGGTLRHIVDKILGEFFNFRQEDGFGDDNILLVAAPANGG